MRVYMRWRYCGMSSIMAPKQRDDMLNAMSHLIPRQVTKCRTYRNGNQITSYPVCPRCYISMEREYMAFCDRCGQKLAWDRLSKW